MTVHEVERAFEAANAAADAVLAKLRAKPAGSIEYVRADGDVLAKASASALEHIVADVAARVTAHVRKALGLPQPRDLTSGEPVALKKASTFAEDTLRSNAASLTKAAEKTGHSRLAELAADKQATANVCEAVKAAHLKPEMATPETLLGRPANVPARPDVRPALRKELEDARANGDVLAVERLMRDLQNAEVAASLRNPRPWRPADAEPSDVGTPASDGVITPAPRAGTQLLGTQPV